MIHVLRHTQAGKRKHWDRPDEERPSTTSGGRKRAPSPKSSNLIVNACRGEDDVRQAMAARRIALSHYSEEMQCQMEMV